MPYVENGVLYDKWLVEDVHYQTNGMFKVPLNDDECMKVLELMAEYHDANQGLNWEFMLYCIDELFGDREKVEEDAA